MLSIPEQFACRPKSLLKSPSYGQKIPARNSRFARKILAFWSREGDFFTFPLAGKVKARKSRLVTTDFLSFTILSADLESMYRMKMKNFRKTKLSQEPCDTSFF
jgi:hypothetical protein